jgi:cytochrome c-type biogenesis protein CcmF
MVAILLGIFSAITQYLKYKGDVKGTFLKKIVLPTLIAAIITAILAVVYPITFYKHGAGFLGALYVGLFASIYAFIANAGYIWTGLNGKFKAAGGSISHIGFAIMIAGMLISAGNRKVISEEKIKSISIPMGIDPLTKQQDNAAENINLIRQVPNKMGEYTVTYLKDSLGHEAGRRFYQLYFERKDPVTNAVSESFYLSPDVYMMKDNNMSSNPDTRSYFTHDVFTYISYTIDPSKNTDTAQFKISEVAEGDTIFYSKGFMVLEKVIKNPTSNKFNIPLTGPAVVLDIVIQTQDSMKYHAYPMITVDSIGINQFDDTVYAQNLYVKFAGITEDQKKLKIGVKESSKLLDFVTLKAFIFPYINLVWIGLVIMSVGFILGMIYRAGIKGYKAIAILTVITIALFYMFMFAGT